MDNLKNTTSSIFTIRQYNICVKFIKILYFSESVVEWAIVETIPGETNPESETETIPWESQFI